MFRTVLHLAAFTTLTMAAIPVHATTCIEFHAADHIGEFSSEAISESSGLAVSGQHSDTLWTHNDSGDSARFYAFSSSGQSRGIINLSGASAYDWEAMAIGPCDRETCLVIGDVGDNNSERDDVSLWRLTEPTPTGEGTEQIVSANEIRLVYPGGAQDCEGIAIDPLTGDVILVEKAMVAKARIHRLPTEAWDTQDDDPRTLELVATINFETDSLTGGLITGADIAPSGTELFVRTYIAGFHVPITRTHDGTINGFGAVRQVSVYDDGQCEAVAYDSTGLELWFTCEDENGPIARADCKTSRDDETGVTTTDEGGCMAASGLWPLICGLLLVRRRKLYGSAS